MPELPEVETVIKTLRKQIINKTINDVVFYYDKVLENITPKEFREKIINQKITDIYRNAKYIIFQLNDYCLITHLRMEGKFFVLTQINQKINNHKIVSFQLDNNQKLIYHDTRRFGKMSLVAKEDLNQYFVNKRLAKEPYQIDYEKFYQLIKDKKVKIKSILLNQSLIAGLGNIYVDETLFLSNVNPHTRANMLTKKEIYNIIDNSKIILDKAILLGGSSVHSFSYGDEISGLFQNELNIYGRENKPCKNCHNLIIKDKINSRGTHYCPICQKLKK